MAINVPDDDSRASASAVDADSTSASVDAADAESKRIQSWTQSKFAGGGRQQSQLDPSFGRKEK